MQTERHQRHLLGVERGTRRQLAWREMLGKLEYKETEGAQKTTGLEREIMQPGEKRDRRST